MVLGCGLMALGAKDMNIPTAMIWNNFPTQPLSKLPHLPPGS